MLLSTLKLSTRPQQKLQGATLSGLASTISKLTEQKVRLTGQRLLTECMRPLEPNPIIGLPAVMEATMSGRENLDGGTTLQVKEVVESVRLAPLNSPDRRP